MATDQQTINLTKSRVAVPVTKHRYSELSQTTQSSNIQVRPVTRHLPGLPHMAQNNIRASRMSQLNPRVSKVENVVQMPSYEQHETTLATINLTHSTHRNVLQSYHSTDSYSRQTSMKEPSPTNKMQSTFLDFTLNRVTTPPIEQKIMKKAES